MIASFLLAVVAVFLAGVLGGFTGFGISVFLVPLLLVVYEQPTVVVSNGALRGHRRGGGAGLLVQGRPPGGAALGPVPSATDGDNRNDSPLRRLTQRSLSASRQP